MFCRNVLTQGIKFVRLFQENKIYQQLTLSTAKKQPQQQQQCKQNNANNMRGLFFNCFKS